MSVLTPSYTFPQPPVPTVPVFPLTVEQYHAMIVSGILTEDHPVELLAGLLVPKMPKNPAHSASTRRLRKLLQALVPAGWFVDIQEPVTLSDSEPEPDVTIVRGQEGDYDGRHPAPGDLGLVVEVSESTLDRDRGLKLGLYAAAGLPVYWIVNLVDRQIEVYSLPSGGVFARRQVFGSADEVSVEIDGQLVGRIRVSDVLP